MVPPYEISNRGFRWTVPERKNAPGELTCQLVRACAGVTCLTALNAGPQAVCFRIVRPNRTASVICGEKSFYQVNLYFWVVYFCLA